MLDNFKNTDEEIFGDQIQIIIKNLLNSIVEIDSLKPNYCFLVILNDSFTLSILKEMIENILLENDNSIDSSDQNQYYQYNFDDIGNILEGKICNEILLIVTLQKKLLQMEVMIG